MEEFDSIKDIDNKFIFASNLESNIFCNKYSLNIKMLKYIFNYLSRDNLLEYFYDGAYSFYSIYSVLDLINEYGEKEKKEIYLKFKYIFDYKIIFISYLNDCKELII